MAGLNKIVQKKFQETTALDTMQEVISPAWFIDPSTSEALPYLDNVNKLKKLVTIDGHPCKNKEWLEGVYKALKLVAGISTLKAEKKKVFPKLNFSHTVEKHTGKDVLHIRGTVSLPCRLAHLNKENTDEYESLYYEDAVKHGRFFNIGAKERYETTVFLLVKFSPFGQEPSMSLEYYRYTGWNKVRPSEVRTIAWKTIDDQTPIRFEDVFDNYMKLKY